MQVGFCGFDRLHSLPPPSFLAYMSLSQHFFRLKGLHILLVWVIQPGGGRKREAQHMVRPAIVLRVHVITIHLRAQQTFWQYLMSPLSGRPLGAPSMSGIQSFSKHTIASWICYNPVKCSKSSLSGAF